VSIETDLHSHLAAYAGLTALVGTRIYPLKAKSDAATPYCVHQIISDVRQYSHSGFSGLSRYRVQVSCYGEDTEAASGYATVKAVAAQVVAAMEAWHTSNAKVQSCLCEDGPDDYNEATEACHIPLDFIVWYG
jgi:hypothetical protein